jgi:hypothetical protein
MTVAEVSNILMGFYSKSTLNKRKLILNKD